MRRRRPEFRPDRRAHYLPHGNAERLANSDAERVTNRDAERFANRDAKRKPVGFAFGFPNNDAVLRYDRAHRKRRTIMLRRFLLFAF